MDRHEKIAARKARTRVAATQVVAREYAPELRLPEDEIRSIGVFITKVALSDAPVNMNILKILIDKLKVAFKKAKADAKIDQREFEAAVDGEVWLREMTVEVQKAYEALGYTREETPTGCKFRRMV